MAERETFGKAEFMKKLVGKTEFSLVRYASKLYPGHEFTFKHPVNARGNGLFQCVDCKALKNKFRSFHFT